MAQVVPGRYKPDHKSMAAFLLSEDVNRVSMEAGGDIAGAARDNMAPFSRTGGTAAGYKVRPVIAGHDAEGGPRRSAEVYNEDPGAAANEFGYGNVPERRPLRNAAAPYHTPRIQRRAT